MENDKRKKRAIILLLLALCCTVGATYVVGGRDGKGFFFASKDKDKDKDDKIAAAAAGAGGAGRQSAGVGLASAPDLQFMGQETPLQQEVALVSVRHHAAEAGVGAGSFQAKAEDNLFTAGDPAAGIPSGKFIVAQNDVASPAAEPQAGPVSPGGGGGTFAHPEANGAGPSPTGNAGAAGDGLLRTAGTGNDTPPLAVPEASPLAMMGLGALLLAVAAARRRHSA